MSKHFIIGTAGHVDHGKTALIKALTGFDCDTHQEEKKRGITINLGFTHIDLPSGLTAGIVDVPGHKDFIKTMIAGAYGIDLVLLVVAANSGIMPQTKEHIEILQMLGIKHCIVVITKTDLVDQDTYELAFLEISEFLENTPFRGAPIVGVSAINNSGVSQLVGVLDNELSKIPDKNAGYVFRMYIDRIFNIKGQGVVVTGSVLNGSVNTGDELFLLPGRERKVYARKIEKHSKEQNSAFAGDRVAINLAGLKLENFSRGMILSNQNLKQSQMLDATLTLFDVNVSLGVWSTVLFQTGTFNCMSRIHLLNAVQLKGREEAIVQIHLENSAVVLNHDHYIIRNSSDDITLGGGTIFDTEPLHHRRITQALTDKLIAAVGNLQGNNDLHNRIVYAVNKEIKPIALPELSRALGVDINEIEAIIPQLNDELFAYMSDTGHYLASNLRIEDLKAAIKKELETFHSQNKLLAVGLSVNQLESKLKINDKALALLLKHVLQLMIENNQLKIVDKTYILFSHTPEKDNKYMEQLDWILDTLYQYNMQVPVMQDVEKKWFDKKLGKPLLKQLIKQLADEKKVYYADGEYIHHAILDKCRKSLLRELKDKPKGINEKEFRELIDGTKRLVQLLITIFIQEGIIEKQTFYLLITEKGRALLNSWLNL